MTDNPARQTVHLLIAKGAAAPSGRWQAVWGDFGANMADDAILVGGGQLVGEGRDFRTGDQLGLPEIQVRVRARTGGDAYAKLLEIMAALAALRPREPFLVTPGAGGPPPFLALAAHLTSGPLPMGQEEKGGRAHYSANYKVHFRRF